MDRDTVRKGSSQCYFINVFMLPLFQKLSKVWLQVWLHTLPYSFVVIGNMWLYFNIVQVFPQASKMVDKLQESLQFYKEMSKAEEQKSPQDSEKAKDLSKDENDKEDHLKKVHHTQLH